MKLKTIQGVEVHASHCMRRGQLIQTQNKAVMCPHDCAQFLLGMSEGDYSEVFKTLGVNSETLDAVTDYAYRKVCKQIADEN